MMVQDIYRNHPWKMFVACMMLNRAKGNSVKKVMREFFSKFPTLQDVAIGDIETMTTLLKPLGLQSRRAQNIQSFAGEMLMASDGYGIEPTEVAEFHGIGEYALESQRVFLDREFDASVNDDRIREYLARCIHVNDVETELKLRVDTYGTIVERDDGRVRQMIGHTYKFDDNVFCATNDFREEAYVEAKLADNAESIGRAIRMLVEDKLSRRSVVIFGQEEEPPNCTVCMHFQVEPDDELTVQVYQRSQDVEMIAKDCETYARIACLFCEEIQVDGYEIHVTVGNLHRYMTRL